MKSGNPWRLHLNVKSFKHRFTLHPASFILLFYGIAFCTAAAIAQKSIGPEWKFECQCNEIAPVSYIDEKITYDGKPTLVSTGGGKEYADGHWYCVMDVEPGVFSIPDLF